MDTIKADSSKSIKLIESVTKPHKSMYSVNYFKSEGFMLIECRSILPRFSPVVFSHLIDIINEHGDYVFDNKPIEKLKLGEKTMRKQIIVLKDDQITEVGYHCNQRSINFIRAIRDQANKAMQAALPDEYINNWIKVSLLYSLKGSSRNQLCHIDMDNESGNNGLIIMIPLEDDFEITIFPSSHKSPCFRTLYPIRLLIPVGNILLFNPLLYHSGRPHPKGNLRVHLTYYSASQVYDNTIHQPPLDICLSLATPNQVVNNQKVRHADKGNKKSIKRLRAMKARQAICS